MPPASGPRPLPGRSGPRRPPPARSRAAAAAAGGRLAQGAGALQDDFLQPLHRARAHRRLDPAPGLEHLPVGRDLDGIGPKRPVHDGNRHLDPFVGIIRVLVPVADDDAAGRVHLRDRHEPQRLEARPPQEAVDADLGDLGRSRRGDPAVAPSAGGKRQRQRQRKHSHRPGNRPPTGARQGRRVLPGCARLAHPAHSVRSLAGPVVRARARPRSGPALKVGSWRAQPPPGPSGAGPPVIEGSRACRTGCAARDTAGPDSAKPREVRQGSGPSAVGIGRPIA